MNFCSKKRSTKTVLRRHAEWRKKNTIKKVNGGYLKKTIYIL